MTNPATVSHTTGTGSSINSITLRSSSRNHTTSASLTEKGPGPAKGPPRGRIRTPCPLSTKRTRPAIPRRLQRRAEDDPPGLWSPARGPIRTRARKRSPRRSSSSHSAPGSEAEYCPNRRTGSGANQAADPGLGVSLGNPGEGTSVALHNSTPSPAPASPEPSAGLSGGATSGWTRWP